MAALVSHEMHRFPSSSSDAAYSSYNLRRESSSRHGGDISDRCIGSTGALSRSMRYADPWLYGSVRASGGLLLTPALVLCQCPDYLTDSRRSSSKKTPHTCKKCKGTRLPISPVESKFGTVRCYPTTQASTVVPMRAGTVRVTSSSRPSILPTPDPYDLMRRSRLSVPETTVTVSPFRDLAPSPSRSQEPHKKPQSLSRSRGLKLDPSYNSTFGRRSILECNINPYDLMSSDAKSNNLKNSKSVALVGGQRIRVRPKLDQPEYEDVNTSKSSRSSTKSPPVTTTLSTIREKNQKSSESIKYTATSKESDSGYNTLTNGRFKSILKKRGSSYNGDLSPYSDAEEIASPTSPKKTGTRFYIPVPLPLTPRKKVQFVDAGKSDTSEDEDRQEGEDLVENDEEDDNQEELYEVPLSDEIPQEEDDDVFEDALEEMPTVKEASVNDKSASSKTVKKTVKVHRSNSDRRNAKVKNVDFFDSMALRTKRRGDARIIFSNEDLEKLDGITTRTRKLSTSKPRPTSPPPPPPPTTQPPESLEFQTNAVETLENEIIINKTEPVDDIEIKDDIEAEENNVVTVAHKISVSSNESVESAGSSSNFSDDSEPLNQTPPCAPPRKRSSNKQQLINIVKPPSLIQTVKVQSPLNETPNKTVVQISSPPTMHKIQIKNEFPDFSQTSNYQTISIIDNPQRKTSILINGDDCYSTVNVNDNVPLYQSSVVVNDEPVLVNSNKNSSRIYITGTFISQPEENESVVPEIKDSKSTINIGSTGVHNKINEGSLTKNDSKLDGTNGKQAEEQSSLTTNSSSSSSSSELIKEILRNPVEAVRQNLVPHVCGKSDMPRRPRDLKFPSPIAPPNSNTLFDHLLEQGTFPLSIEDSLSMLRNERSVEEDVASEHSSAQYELMDQSSECYTDHSNRSSVTEEELSNRTKFYELLAEAENVEVSENDDHHYESIKVNNDPIYEEIEIPPPLPANPPPSTILDDLQLDKEYTTRSIFEGASKYDILSYLVDAKERGIVQEDGYTYNYNTNANAEDETKEPYNRVSHMSTVSDSSEDNSLIISGALIDEKATFQKPAEVERNDSGVGSETSKTNLSKYRSKTEIFACCEDCEATLESKTENDPLLCRKCLKKRSERKEIITEIVETEEKYSKDLQIILEEFYQPMLVAGLLTPDQLSTIFLNVEELLENSQALAERLRDAVEIALEQGDDDLLTVNIGKLFLEAAPMLHAFETYCVRQGTSSLLLASLEKEKELLRIFLRVSQMENTMLRRMNLNSFLMVPVQRVTKYPLLLARLYKVTPSHYDTREHLKEAQHKIELHLNHMNSETKDVPSKLWRRIGNSSGRRASTEMDLVNIKLRKIAVDVLEWNHDEARFVLEGKLLFTQPTDNYWRKGRTIKLAPVNALLVINGKASSTKPSADKFDDNGLVFSARHSGVREAALLLVRDKNGRYSLLREPLYLDRCVIAADPAWQSYFEVQELLGKDTFIFKAEDDDQTHLWYKKLQQHAQGMGAWRKRRNALANIMINGMGLRS
ncbi:rho guanine nucleotide exchange factor at 64C [Rhynchophorus ferrugineus]|uniref:rho guanine nucleotide exchange factor at 64C n=1 Tax=Rhynchophorus ferrugineus TaxID=354439 RepID=UPI003FCE75E4